MVGLHPIPVVHGLTMGVYASMVYGDHWMPATENEQWRTTFEKKGGIEVVVQGYSHREVFKNSSSSIQSASRISGITKPMLFRGHTHFMDEVPVRHLPVLVPLVGRVSIYSCPSQIWI